MAGRPLLGVGHVTMGWYGTRHCVEETVTHILKAVKEKVKLFAKRTKNLIHTFGAHVLNNGHELINPMS